MTAATHCHKCGASLDASARVGVCSSCLEKLGSAPWLEDGPTGELDGATASEPLRQFGDYELLEEIARGGMGVVYRARQLNLKRVVALKMIRAERMSQARAAERFQLEAEAAAKLDHPNIVPIYEIGEYDGQHYYTMKLIEGCSLAQELNGKPLPPRHAAEWIAVVARALHYAHQRGVLHRDIKPGNILIDSDERPHLLDFGLAKLLEADSTLTQTEAVLGSPAYMAPEQASGHARQLTVAADIYSLGAVLYETLSGRPPFRAGTSLETMRRVVEEEPERPTAVQHSVDQELETICLKCLEKEPARRYASAAVLADELERWLRGEPIQARRTTAWQRTIKWARRKPAIAALIVTVVLVAFAGLTGILWQWRKANLHAARELRQRQAAEANLYAADMILAGMALQENDFGKARALLARHEPRRPSEVRDPKSELDLRGWEWRYIRGQCANDELFTLEGHSPSLSLGVAFLSTNLLVSASSDGTIRLWNLAERREVRALHHGSPLQMFRVSPDGQLLVANDENAKKMFIWDRETFALVYSTRSATDSGGWADFLPDGRTLFFYQSRSNIARLTLGPRKPREEFWMKSTPRSSLACSPNGEFMAVSDNDSVSIRNLKRGSTVSVDLPAGPTNLARVRVICFSPDSQLLILKQETTIHLVDAQTGRWLRSHEDHRQHLGAIRFSLDGRLLITAGDQAIRFQDIDSSSLMANFRGHFDQIVSLAVSPDGRLLATGAKDGSIKIWNGQPPVQKDSLQDVLNRTSRVHFTPDSKQFVTVDWVGNGSEIKVWDTATASMTDRFMVEGEQVLDATLLGSQRKLALVAKDERVEVRDLATHHRISQLLPASDKPPGGWALDLPAHWLFEADEGRKLICVQGVYGIGTWTPLDRRGPLSVHVCDVASLTPVRSWRFPFGFGVTGANFSPDGKVLVVGGHDGELSVLSLEDGRTIKADRPHSYAVAWIEFSPTRPLMATAAMDGYLQLWDTHTWERKARLRADPNEIYSVAFHPDGTRMVTGAQGNTPLTVWEVESGRELARLQSPLGGQINRLCFLDHDTLLGWTGRFVLGLNDKVVIWRAPSIADIAALKAVPQHAPSFKEAKH